MTLRVMTTLAACVLVAASQVNDKEKKEVEKLQGTWRLAAVEQYGKRQPEENLKDFTVEFRGDTFFLKNKDRVQEKNRFRLDPDQKPPAMVVVPQRGKRKDLEHLGIYQLKDDELKMCWDYPEKERPREFTTKEGKTMTYIVLKRAKP